MNHWKYKMSDTIDPYSPIPKYHQIVSIISQKIENGEWAPQSLIMSERELEKKLGVSRTTIRQSLNELNHMGLIYSEHGKGNFVSPQKLQRRMMELTSFSEDLIKRGLHPGQIILEYKRVIPPPKIQDLLELNPSTTVLMVNRIRTGDGEPFGLQISYDALDEDQNITLSELEKEGSLDRLFYERFNINVVEADESLEVTQATPDEAKLLHIKENAPLFLNERISYKQDRKPFGYAKSLFRGDKYRFNFNLRKYKV